MRVMDHYCFSYVFPVFSYDLLHVRNISNWHIGTYDH